MAVELNKDQALKNLSLTPLIDIVFLLLIFFLVASRFEKEERALKLKLPSADQALPQSATPTEFVEVNDKSGKYVFHDRAVNLFALEKELRQSYADNPGVRVVIRAAATCPFRYVVAVMNLCNRIGIKDYNVATSDEQ